MFDPISLGLRIAHYRKMMSYSQKQLGDILGIAQASVYKMEAGKIQALNITKLARVADALNVTLDTLLVDSLEKFKDDFQEPQTYYKSKVTDMISTLTDEQLAMLDEFLDYKSRGSAPQVMEL